MTRGEGRDGFAVQLVIIPLMVGVCVAIFPTVSTSVPGLNVTTGVAIVSTVKFKAAVTEPVLFAAVIT